MKRFFQIVPVLALAVSCSRNDERIGGDPITMNFSAVIESSDATKTTLAGNPSDSHRNTLWLPSDSILVTNGTAASQFVNIVDTISATAVFEGSLPVGKTYFAAYPYSFATGYSSSSLTITLPSSQTFYEDGISSDCAPMVAKSGGDVLNFRNLCGILVLQLTGSGTVSSISFSGKDANGHSIPVSGTGTVSMNYTDDPSLVMDSSSGFSVTLKCPHGVSLSPTVSKTFHIVLPPATYSAFTVTVVDVNGETAYFNGTKPLVVKRSERITAKSTEVIPDLSAAGTANCYVVSQAGKYKFKATVKGSTSEPVGTPFSAEVLWESFGTEEAPNVGDIISNVSCSDGYVTFSTPSPLKNGNSVIAVKDASGNILWSWHIWLCSGFNPETSAQYYNHNAGVMMDRNLGATSATPGDVHALGLLYQWGRKDPFMGGCLISYSSAENQERAKSTGEWPSVIESTSSTGTFDYVEKHPMQFITQNSSNQDWYYPASSFTENTRWRTSDKDKGKYDPCPPGWRVPDGGSGIWSTAFGTNSAWKTASNWDDTDKGMDFGKTDKKLGRGQIWYPAAGFLSENNGSLNRTGIHGIFWSCSPLDYSAYYLRFDADGEVSPSGFDYRASGSSVRCVSE